MGISKRFASEEYVNEQIVQPDWLVNDEANQSYIKNKPFGEEISLTEIDNTASSNTLTFGENCFYSIMDRTNDITDH